jgi:hypothetical protein
MLSRREFLSWASGLLAIRGAEGGRKGTPVHKRERPAESVQQLIEQIRFLERGTGSKAHVQVIQDQIRVRLLLSGLACVYVEEDGQSYICALETSTGCLWCLPQGQSAQSWARKAFTRIGLKGLESRVKTLSKAYEI